MVAKDFWREMGLNDDEYRQIVAILGREPNYLETGMFSVMWSEHCGYKSSRPILKWFPTDGPQVIEGPGENAGVVDIGDGQALVFKIESHNHPSAIEPYWGAATGVGGIVRDIFAMGARPIALLDSLRFGTLDDERTRFLLSGATSGIADYGKGLEVPTLAGEVYFHPSYRDNCLVNAMCVGLVETAELARAVAGKVGGLLVLAGAKTGRDAIHGATFASVELSEETEARTVLVSDPSLEKLLMEACLELIKKDLVAGMQDLGAAGLTSSVAEMASKGERGVEVDVLKVPRREEGMTSYEIMLSESQERMLVIPREGAVEQVQEVFARWGVESAVIGRITDDGLFRVKEGDQVMSEIPVKALTDMCPVYHRESREPEYYQAVKGFNLRALPEPRDYNQVLITLLGSHNIASKEWIYTHYDSQVMASTVLEPGRGDAGVLRIKGSNKGVAMTVDCNSRYCYLDPYRGGIMAVCEAARNLACSGARPLALTNCLNFGNPEKPEVFWQFTEAVKGMARAALELNTPVVSGNVSLYNETRGGEAVYPTPVVGMVGVLEDVNRHIDIAFKNEGDVILLLGRLRDEIGGSEYLSLIHGLDTGEVPQVDVVEERKLIEFMLALSDNGLIKSSHDLSEGGLAVCLAESAIKGGIGTDIDLKIQDLRYDGVLFGEASSRIVVTAAMAQAEQVLKMAQDFGVRAAIIGKTGGQVLKLAVNGRNLIDITVAEMSSLWEGAIRCAMS